MTIQEIVPSKPIVAQAKLQRLSPLLHLVTIGILLELLYIVLLALSPLPGLHLSNTPLPVTWPWTLAPSHFLFPGAQNTASDSFEKNWFYLLLLALTLIGLAVVYAIGIRDVFRMLQRDSIHSPTRWLLLLLIVVALFGLTLMLQPALFSGDVFSYIFSGRLLGIYHVDPLNTAPILFAHDPFIHWTPQIDTPTIYGPLWFFLSSSLAGISNSPVATLLLFKGVALLSHCINCVLLWAILSKVAPTYRLLGTFLYAWNPLVLIELAGSGHNEGLFIGLLLLAIWLYLQGQGQGQGKRRWFETGTLALLGLAIADNSIASLFVPLFIWFMIRTEGDIAKAAWGFCWRMLVVLAIVVLVYLPFWRGPSTFLAITSDIDTEHFVYSPLETLAVPIRWLFTMIAQVSHFPPIMQPATAADVTLRSSAALIYVLIYIRLFGQIRHSPVIAEVLSSPDTPDAGQEMLTAEPGDGPSAGRNTNGHRGREGIDQSNLNVLFSTWSTAIFWYFVLVSGLFWPWFTLPALWVAALRRIDAITVRVLLLSGTALLIYPLRNLPASPLTVYEPLLIFGIPIVYVVSSRIWGTERMKLFHDRRSKATQD